MENLILKEVRSLYLLKEIRASFHTIEDLLNNDYTDEKKIYEILNYIENKTNDLGEKHIGVIPNYVKIYQEVELSEFRYYLFSYIYPELEETIKAYDTILLNKFIKNSFIQ